MSVIEKLKKLLEVAEIDKAAADTQYAKAWFDGQIHAIADCIEVVEDDPPVEKGEIGERD